MSKSSEQRVIKAAMRLVGKNFYAWNNEHNGQALCSKSLLRSLETACEAHAKAKKPKGRT
jgi:hypothetical protein